MSLLWVTAARENHLPNKGFPNAHKTYYHASTEELHPGDILKPGGDEKNNWGTGRHRDKVFLSRSEDDANGWADMLAGHQVRPAHVYEVEASESNRHPINDGAGEYEYTAPTARVFAHTGYISEPILSGEVGTGKSHDLHYKSDRSTPEAFDGSHLDGKCSCEDGEY